MIKWVYCYNSHVAQTRDSENTESKFILTLTDKSEEPLGFPGKEPMAKFQIFLFPKIGNELNDHLKKYSFNYRLLLITT